MPSLTFTVPWDALCSDNRKFVSGSFVLTAEYRSSKEAIALHAKVAAKKAKWKQATGPVALEAVVTEPDRRGRDLNWSKNAKDGISLSDAVWEDDVQVRYELWRFKTAHKDGSVDKATAGAVITVRTLE